MASLLDQQRAFAAALRDRDGMSTAAGVAPVVNLDVYRHNSDWQFRNALGLSFPVVRRRVGDDYFRELATEYRRRFPSRSGDLHWVGRDFAGFLAAHLEGSDYAWLADLATLEWARELASVAETRSAIGAEALAGFAPEDLEQLVFTFQPSLQLGASVFPVVSVWLANQVENAPPVSQSVGPEAYMVHVRHDSVETTMLEPPLHAYLSALKAGARLAEAMSTADLDEAALLAALQFMFSRGMVCAIYSENR
ncbi:MAG TPA: DNA-binding domain-containing protein [Steroidobacteraceae bacterium]|nr:DNA-binding domain-containing protein [Steroidobacteraceae bacterium]